MRGQRDDGRFLYGYTASRDEVSSDYNSTRHAGVMDALYRLGRIRAADAGLRYVRRNLIRHDGWTAFAPAGEDANVGANALLVVALMHRRQATGDGRYDGLARRLGRFLLAQERGDGSVLQYWRPATGRSVPDVFGKFSTGEAFYALALMRGAFPDGGLGAARAPGGRLPGDAPRRGRGPLGTARPDHWAAYGLAELAPAGLTDVEAELRAAGWRATSASWSASSRSTWAGALDPFLGVGRVARDRRRGDGGALAARGRGPAARRPPRADLGERERLPDGHPPRPAGRAGDREPPRARRLVRGRLHADGRPAARRRRAPRRSRALQ